jgi:hypothetical protein
LDTKSKSGLLSGSVKTSSGAKRWSFVWGNYGLIEGRVGTIKKKTT